MKRIALLTFVFCLMAANLAYARIYKIAVGSWAGWSPCHVADAKGFWESEGVDVRVLTTADPLQTLPLFNQKLVDLAFDMLGSVVALRMEGTLVSIVLETDWSHGGDKIIVKKDADASKFKNLPVGVYFNVPSVLYFLGQYLQTVGISLSDTRIIEMEADTLSDNFINGRFSAIVNYDPAAIRAVREGNGKLAATSATYKGSIPEGIFAFDEVLKTIPSKDMVGILKGWIRAAEWIKYPDNWKEYMEILNTRTFPNNPPYSESDLKAMVDAVRIHDRKMLFERNRNGGGLIAYLNDLKIFLKENQMLKKDFDAAAMFKNAAILEALGVDDAPKTPVVE